MTDLMQTTLTAPGGVDMALVVGASDEILHVLEESFDARLTVRGNRIVIEGNAVEVQQLTALFADLFKTGEEGQAPDTDSVRRSVELLRQAEFAPTALRDDVLLTYRGRAIRPKTAGQKHYVDAIREKVDPYIRPLDDALYSMFDQERANALIENGTIEIAPLAFMRGRTLNDAFIILDEAQNTTPEQMKMALTRLGFGSKIVVTGDISQIDLPRGESGLVQVRSVLEGIDDIAFCDLSGKDVVRHSLVATIVAAYERAAGKAR